MRSKYIGTDDVSKIGKNVHPFTVAGLGEGPFTCVGFMAYGGGGYVVENGIANFETCKCCGAAIKNVFYVENETGRTFPVGSTCVLKTPKTGQMYQYASNKMLEEQRKKTEIKRKAKIDEVDDFMTNPNVIAKGDSLPHPKISSLTYYDYMCYILKQCGHSGRTKYLKIFKNELQL